MSIDNLLNRLEGVKRTGQNKWLCRCPGPVHSKGDRHPSLGIKLLDDDKILIRCFVGCTASEIVSSIGLTLADLMPPQPQGYDRTKASPPRFNKSELFDRIAFEAIILSLAIRQLLNGATLPPNDLKRVLLAEQTIDDIARECRR